MKAIASILMILVLFLAGQPLCSAPVVSGAIEHCCEADADCADERAADKEHEGEDCKGCNPFQSCSCCAAGVVMPVHPFIVTASALLHFSKQEPHAEPEVRISGLASGIWQPPRIG